MRKTPALLAMAALALLALMPASLFAKNDDKKDAKQEGPPPMTLKVGDKAPDFTLKDQNGQDVSLHDLTGKKNVVLAFFVFAFTGG
jgi:cytochrome oxidase Cu insertion factor (SCO1/SenC/PrrC family)